MEQKTILFVILDKFADWESAYLSSALNMLAPDEFDVKTVSLGIQPVKSIGGFAALPDFDLGSAPLDKADAVILTGGLSWRSEEAKQIGSFVLAAKRQNKIIGAICDAAAFLGTVGLLNEVEHTANDLTDLKNWAASAYSGEARFICRQAVRSGNIITANGTAPLEFAKEVLYALGCVATEKIREWYDFHKLGFYNGPLPKM